MTTETQEFGEVPEEIKSLHESIKKIIENPIEGATEVEKRAFKQMSRLSNQIVLSRLHKKNKFNQDIKITEDHKRLLKAANSLSKKIPKEEGRDHALYSTLSGALQNVVSLKVPPTLEVETVDSLEEIEALLKAISPSFYTDPKEKSRVNSALQGLRGLINARNGIVTRSRGSRSRGERRPPMRGNSRGPPSLLVGGRNHSRTNNRGGAGRGLRQSFPPPPRRGRGRGRGNRGGFAKRGSRNFGNRGRGTGYSQRGRGMNPYSSRGQHNPYGSRYSQQNFSQNQNYGGGSQSQSYHPYGQTQNDQNYNQYGQSHGDEQYGFGYDSGGGAYSGEGGHGYDGGYSEGLL